MTGPDPLTSLLTHATTHYHLTYLRGPAPWEASLRCPITHPRYAFAVGFGAGPDPITALSRALDAIETDAELQTSPVYLATIATGDAASPRPSLSMLIADTLSAIRADAGVARSPPPATPNLRRI